MSVWNRHLYIFGRCQLKPVSRASIQGVKKKRHLCISHRHRYRCQFRIVTYASNTKLLGKRHPHHNKILRGWPHERIHGNFTTVRNCLWQRYGHDALNGSGNYCTPFSTAHRPTLTDIILIMIVSCVEHLSGFQFDLREAINGFTFIIWLKDWIFVGSLRLCFLSAWLPLRATTHFHLSWWVGHNKNIRLVLRKVRTNSEGCKSYYGQQFLTNRIPIPAIKDISK